ncbi:hypothetical protein NTE_01962 [Candidatus Nitrososphaera evergladensis SR1]|jgi:hypothetical protein|uniref:Uncharacterized protein n=1 Tax=Candidatus Nitrososphaera evergladensis SR1 TaxID=1459636 RepID=A0A075MSD0_9ARCH|nr:hypothetical protein [Candidatus Nitrososphaera evergladensis]AIF84020.1 hypothetical protein NTE_01962 [Candidatus Nitrososphaera evergladensis SR1]
MVRFFRTNDVKTAYIMSYEPDDGGGGMFARTSGKRLAILFGLAFFGAFMLIQVVQGFPLRDILIREKITEERAIAIKQGDLCVIDTPDHPREIKNCPYNVGDRVIVTYSKNNAAIEAHRLAG